MFATEDRLLSFTHVAKSIIGEIQSTTWHLHSLSLVLRGVSVVLAVKPTIRVVLVLDGVVPLLVTDRLMPAGVLVAGLVVVVVVAPLAAGVELDGPLASTERDSVLPLPLLVPAGQFKC